MRVSRHYLALTGAIALGAVLRFALLDSKPLWLDEIITALFSLGRSYNDVPLDVVFPGEKLEQIFTFNPLASCSQISQTVATQSTHPPLFFCLMHSWVGMFGMGAGDPLQVRSLPALFGVGAIAAIYLLNRVAYSPKAGLIAAAVMAVSPFAVYLSQEARHYSLPMLLITLALLGLIQIQQDLCRKRRVRLLVWVSWVVVNTIGLYAHYFFILALVAQVLTLLSCQVRSAKAADYVTDLADGLSVSPQNRISVSSVTKSVAKSVAISLLPFAFFLPWFPVLLSHFNRPETEWSKPFEPSWVNSIAPVYQTLAGWVIMAIALPVENQPLWIAVPCGLLMIGFAVWLVRHIWRSIRELYNTPDTHLSTMTLGIFTIFVLLEFFAIVYVLGKDITSAVRYNFIYYPSICALLGASLTQVSGARSGSGIRYQNSSFIVLLVGVLSCIFVVSNLVFQKPYDPQGVARNMNLEPSNPLVVVVGYDTFQEVALGLSFALEVHKQRPDRGETPGTYFAFLKRSPGYPQLWQNLARVSSLPPSPLNLWVVAPGLRQREYPPKLAIATQTACTLDPTQYYRIGIPYQLYRCQR